MTLDPNAKNTMPQSVVVTLNLLKSPRMFTATEIKATLEELCADLGWIVDKVEREP